MNLMGIASPKRTLSTIALVIAALSSSAHSAAADPAPAAAAPVEWVAAHSTAAASGSRWTEQDVIWPALIIEGELRNTGTGCFSVWVRWIHDFSPSPYARHATQCGDEAAPVNIRLSPYLPTTTGQLKVCRGTEDTTDCGPVISLTTWPIDGPSRAASHSQSPSH